MNKYQVNKETYDDKLIDNLGEMTIDELRVFAKKFIGDVFKDENDIEKCMEYIIENNEELWLCKNKDGYFQISIYMEDDDE